MSNNWTMYFDGSKRKEGARAGVVLISPKGDRMMYVLHMNWKDTSNNEAEYEALIHGMKMAKICGATRIMIYDDSNLVVQQTMKECDAPSENMAAYRELYNKLEGEFDGCELQHIVRGSNSEADALANIASKCEPVPPNIFYEEINHPSIKLKHPEKEEEKNDAAGNNAEEPEEEK